MLAVSPVIRHRVNALAVEIRPCYIPFIAVARRPQQKRAFIRADQQEHVAVLHREVLHSPQHQHPRSSRFVRGAPALQHRALHGLERHANFACALVSLQALLA